MEYSGMDDVLVISSIDTRIPLKALYERVVFKSLQGRWSFHQTSEAPERFNREARFLHRVRKLANIPSLGLQLLPLLLDE